MSHEAKNLKAIVSAIKQHDLGCDSPALEIQMNPFEVDRLGWEDVMGIPITGNDKLGTGMFRIICDGLHEETKEEITEAISPQKEFTYSSV